MTTKKAFDRLAYTISKQNKPNQTDLEALKTIAEYVDLSKKQEVTSNYLFAKIYSYSFLNEVCFYRESFKSGYLQAQKKLHKILASPLTDIIKRTMDRINTHEYDLFAKSIGLLDTHPATKTESIIEKERELIKGNEKDLLKYAFGVHDYKEFEATLTDQISEAINKYKAIV